MSDRQEVDDFARRLAERVRYFRSGEPGRARSSRSASASLVDEIEAIVEELRIVGEDLRSQKGALQEAVRVAEHERVRFEHLFEMAPDAWLVTDPYGMLLDCNRAAARLLRIARDRLRGKPLAAFLEPRSAHGFRASLQRLARLEQVKDVELDLLPRRGDPIRVVALAGHVPAGGGKEPRIVWVLREPEDTKASEGPGAKPEPARGFRGPDTPTAQAGFLARATAELGTELDPGRLPVRIAELAREAFGDACFVDLVTPEGRIHGTAVARRGRKRGGEGPVPPRPLETGSDAARVVETGAPVVRDDLDGPGLAALLQGRELEGAKDASGGAIVPLRVGGESLGLVTVVAARGGEHLSERLPLLEAFASCAALALSASGRIREAERRRVSAEVESDGRSRAMAGLSHELRTPLHSILGYTELLLDGIAGPLADEASRFVQAVRSSALHQSQLVDDILMLARPESGRLVASPVEVSVADAVGECVAMVEESARVRGLVLRVDCAPDLSLVTDRSKLRRILINLLDNAVKYTDTGEVTVSARREGERVRFSVVDTGPGIPEEELPHIFAPFWQGAASRGRPGGAGLGLAFVRRLAELLQGQLEVESVTGVGTRFHVSFPASGFGPSS